MFEDGFCSLTGEIQIDVLASSCVRGVERMMRMVMCKGPQSAWRVVRGGGHDESRVEVEVARTYRIEQINSTHDRYVHMDRDGISPVVEVLRYQLRTCINLCRSSVHAFQKRVF